MATWLLTWSSHPQFLPLLDQNPPDSWAESLFSPLLVLCHGPLDCVALGWMLSAPLSLSAGLCRGLTPGESVEVWLLCGTVGSPLCAPPLSALETRVQALETQQQAERASLRGEKERLRRLLGRQSGALAGLERSLRAARSNSSLLQRQQRQLLESVQRLVRIVAQGLGELSEGMGWGQGKTLPVFSGAWKPPTTCDIEITTNSNNNGNNNNPNRRQPGLFFLTP